MAAVLVARDSSMSLTAAFGLVPGLEEDASSRRGCERCYRSKANCRPVSKRTMRRAQRAEHSNERSSNGSVGRTRRRLDRGSEFVGLYVRVPWSMWGGEWFECDEYETGIVVEYVPPSKKEQSGEGFTVAFDPSSATSDISLSYGELLGEVPCCVTRDAALFRRDHIPVGGPATGRAPRPTKSGGRFYWDRREQGRGSTESARGGTIEPIQVHARPRLHALRPCASRPHALALNAYRYNTSRSARKKLLRLLDR